MNMKKWIMPGWMIQYKDMIVNTGGNTVESLMNDENSNMFNNAPRALICVAIKSQVRLLEELYEKGLLINYEPKKEETNN